LGPSSGYGLLLVSSTIPHVGRCNLFYLDCLIAGFDSGVVVFAFAVGAGWSGLQLIQEYSHRMLNFHIATLVLAHGFITIAYLGGAVLTFSGAINKSTGFGVYCTVFSVLWLVAGVYTLRIALAYKVEKMTL